MTQMSSIRIQEPGIARRLFTNAGLNFCGQIIVLLLNFVTVPFIVHRLGPEMFGVVVLTQTIAGFSGVLNVGIGRALNKYVSSLYWKGDIDQINDIFQTAWTIAILAGLVGVLLVVAPGRSTADIFFRGGQDVSAELISFAIWVAGCALFSTILIEVISAIPPATQRFGVKNAIQVGMSVAWFLGSVALLSAGYSVRAILIQYLILNVIGIGSYIFSSRLIVPGLRFSPRINMDALKRLIVFSLPITMSAISSLLVTRVDRFILAYYLPLAALTYYTLPYSISEKISAAVANVTSVAFPFASELYSMDAHTKVQELYMRASKIVTLVVIPLTVVLLAVPWHILRFWLGEDYAREGTMVLSLLGVSAYINALSAIPTMFSIAAGRVWTCSFFSFAASAINLSSNFLLIPVYGIDGAAWGLLFAQVMTFPFLYLVNRSLKISTWWFFSQTLLRPFGCAAVQFSVLYEIRAYINDLISLLMACLISLIVFGLSVFFEVSSREERQSISAWARGLGRFWRVRYPSDV